MKSCPAKYSLAGRSFSETALPCSSNSTTLGVAGRAPNAKTVRLSAGGRREHRILQAGAVKQVISQNQADRAAADELFPNNERASPRGSVRRSGRSAPLSAVIERRLEAAGLPAN